MTLRAGISLLALNILLAGCSMVPAYDRPAVTMPAAFSQKTAASVAPADRWWTSFGSPELDALEARSLADNGDLQAAIARIEEARAQAGISGAGRFPSLSIGGDVDADNGSANAKGGRDGGGSSAGLFAQASYELDFWGRNRALSRSGQALANASAFDKEIVATTLAADVANSYFQILSLDERLRFARQIADDARHVLTLIEAQHEVGTATELQIEQQRNIVATFDGQVPALAQQLEIAQHFLATLTGQAPQGFTVSADGLDGVKLPKVEVGLPSELLRRRPDLRAAEARVISANFDIGAARAALFPSITLTGQGGLATSALSHVFSPIGTVSGVASLLQPVFDGGRLSGQLRYDKAHKQELAATYRQTVLAAFRDVEDGLSSTARLAEGSAAAERAVRSSKHAAALSEAQFQLGVIDLLTLLDTQRTYFQAQDTLLQIRLQRLQAVVNLYRALGGGFDAPADAVQIR